MDSCRLVWICKMKIPCHAFPLIRVFFLFCMQEEVNFGKTGTLKMSNEDYIREAIFISGKNMKQGGGPFGALIVKDGKVIAKSGNTVALTNDPTAHAEINVIRDASRSLNSFDLSGCLLYSSCEPCPMCLGAIYWARIDRVYFAAGKKDAKHAGFDDSFIYNEMDKPLDRRNIPTIQLLRHEALNVLEEWKDKDDKIEY